MPNGTDRNNISVLDPDQSIDPMMLNNRTELDQSSRRVREPENLHNRNPSQTNFENQVSDNQTERSALPAVSFLG